ncbi:MAG: hypothetical protein KAT32_02205 [Candidatus Moranbacteria bacterium]|nr:hypothetical protein [Candidatus Moranbacteria bacterium]
MNEILERRMENVVIEKYKPELVEVFEDKDDLNVIEIFSDADDPRKIIEKKVIEKLKENNWWLQDYWKEKGEPREKIIIKTSFGTIELYNFSNTLESRHIQELEDIIEAFARMKDENPLSKIKYILLDNIQQINPNIGSDMNGQNWEKCNSLKIYPAGKSFEPHRIPEASNFEGTLIHELSHNFSKQLINDWKDAFGWKELEVPILLEGGGETNLRMSRFR